MSNSIRLRTTVGSDSDKYLKLNFKQDYDFIEILSLKLTQEEAYTRFCSDYGVIAGRITVNSFGVGVPNAKVSVFIPITEEDLENPEISSLYPYEKVNDKDLNGIRYNLLPINNSNENPCYTPVGTFPNKREVLDNPELLDIYCKYYKYTATTNKSGDFMIFGVPLGNYTVHVDLDISDMGYLSQRPFDLIVQGTSEKLFETPTKFKGGKNLDSLPQIKSFNTSVNVLPFWGDLETCEIGITRVDLDLNYNLEPYAIFIGSIFGDSEKNSINKNCRPRADLGELCEQVTSQGLVEMIRKTTDDTIEFGGVSEIDEDGVWIYHVPLNLDYSVTDETGKLVLTDDITRGIPTRANVRFRISMYETGGEGRVRSRAKYLVPNNPDNKNELDFTFGINTKDFSFRDLYWDKIYTIKNFIPRFQSTRLGNIRAHTGIKNVDNCTGTHTPFPFNRIKENANPLFNVLCIILGIIAGIVATINGVFIGLINGIIRAINLIPGVKVNFIPCIGMDCETDEGIKVFAPGCGKKTKGYAELEQREGPIYGVQVNDYTKCQSTVLADNLNVYVFDFYNDWINGTLYSYLFKYRKRIRSSEKFCEYECGGDGVDGNGNGKPDNNCSNSFITDLSYNNNLDLGTDLVRNGLLSKSPIFTGNTIYYAPITRDGKYKLFATDIVNLGSIRDIDWQGKQKIINFIPPTTYKLPPQIEELDDNNDRVTCGMASLTTNNRDGLFFKINCVTGIEFDKTNFYNIGKICELGVGLDETYEDSNGNIIESDCRIGSEDVDSELLRNIFTNLNSTLNTNNVNINIDNNDTLTNATDYDIFRGYTNNLAVEQPQNASYFFYFGIKPNLTAIDKFNRLYLTSCDPVISTEFIISTSTTATTTNSSSDGSISFEVFGIAGNFDWEITGNNYSATGTGDTTNTSFIFDNLNGGTYTITITDEFNNEESVTVTVSGPLPIYCEVQLLENVTSIGGSDAEVIINQIIGGQPPYTLTITDNGSTIRTVQSLTNGLTITGLPSSTTQTGTTFTITDSVGTAPCTTNIYISEPQQLTIRPEDVSGVTCNGGTDGEFRIGITGGTAPYTVTFTAPSGYVSSSVINDNLSAGTYTFEVSDAYGQTETDSVIISEPSPINVTPTDNGNGTFTIAVNGGTSPYTIPGYVSTPFTVSTIITATTGTSITIVDANNCSITLTL